MPFAKNYDANALRFPPVENSVIDRLDVKAEERSQPPVDVDWAAIHAQARQLQAKN